MCEWEYDVYTCKIAEKRTCLKWIIAFTHVEVQKSYMCIRKILKYTCKMVKNLTCVNKVFRNTHVIMNLYGNFLIKTLNCK